MEPEMSRIRISGRDDADVVGARRHRPDPAPAAAPPATTARGARRHRRPGRVGGTGRCGAAGVRRSQHAAQPVGEQHLRRHPRPGHGVPARDARDRPVDRVDVQLLGRRRRAGDAQRDRSLPRRGHRRRLRMSARRRQRRARRRPATAGADHHARHVVDVPGAVAGRERLARRRAVARGPRRAVLRAAERRSAGRDPGRHRHPRGARGRAPPPAAPHALRVPRPRHRQQSGSGPAGRRPDRQDQGRGAAP